MLNIIKAGNVIEREIEEGNIYRKKSMVSIDYFLKQAAPQKNNSYAAVDLKQQLYDLLRYFSFWDEVEMLVDKAISQFRIYESE